MAETLPKLKAVFLVGAYLCIIAILFVDPKSVNWLSQGARCLALPILIIFFYLNTAIDSKFEKNIFYSLVLFGISQPILMAHPILGQASIYIALAIWIIAYFSFARALISITSMSSSLLYKHKWLSGVVFILGLIGLYFYIPSILDSGINMIPLLCLGLAYLVYLMATINLWGQIAPVLVLTFLIGSILLMLYNGLLGLNINSNISIFDIRTSLFLYLGHLLMTIGGIRCSIKFKNNDFLDISSVLNKKEKT